MSEFDTFSFTSSRLVQLIILLAVILSCTRFISGRNYKSEVSSSGTRCHVPTLPYWIPYVGHIPSLISSPSRFLQRCSRQSASGICSLNILAVQHYLVFNPSLISTIFEQSSTAFTFGTVRWSLLVNVFGANKNLKEDYIKVSDDAHACLTRRLLLEPAASEIANQTVSSIQENAPNLVSFSESVVDQCQWERAANASLHVAKSSSKEDSFSVEVNFFALIRNFVGTVSLPSLVGTEFLDVYPKALDDLWDLDGGFNYLTLGLPRWFPIPSFAKAHIARRNLLQGLGSFQEAIDNIAADKAAQQPWIELSDVGAIMKERSSIWRVHGTSSQVKAPFDLGLLWAMSTKSSTMIFWMLIHILAAPGLTGKVRDEIHSFTKATQPPQVFGIPEPNRLNIDIEGLIQSCPLLKACFYECVRLHSTAASVRSVSNSIEVHEPPEGATLVRPLRSYVLEAGHLVATPLGFRCHDPSYDRCEDVFDPSRFLVPSEDDGTKQTVTEGTLKPWGLGVSTCPGRAYAEKEVLAFVAGILTLWEFEPAQSRDWEVPQGTERSVTSIPSADLRVRIKSRPLSAE